MRSTQALPAGPVDRDVYRFLPRPSSYGLFMYATIAGRWPGPAMSAHPIKRFALLGNHLPRHCGIATFTTHLIDALAQRLPDADGFVLAMNDAGRRHAYPSRVRFEIGEADLSAYRRAADFLNVNQVDVLSVQHEYGIFGGKSGAHLLELLRALRMPIVTTLHTILSEPNPSQRLVLDELAKLSERLIVMSESGAALLKQVHGISADQIDLIPHGIPQVPVDGDSKERLGLEGKTVLLTFGLLSPDKGIEYVVDALPAILAAHPDTVYVVLGATHPHVVARDGEAYRLMLEARARQLGVDGHMIFHNRFVSQEELTEFLSAADIYITPYLNPEQITSGTLAYAVGAGKAVISTPYIYARELLADGRGVLVPWRDSGAIAREVVDLVGDDGRTQAMCARAAEHGRAMTWPAVANQYVESFSRALSNETRRRRISFEAQTLASRPAGWPEIDLRHVRTLTDDTGILQHAVFSIPRYEDGYCLDDNARALLLMTHRGGGRHGRSGDGRRAGRTLPGLRELRVQSIVRPLPQLSVVRAAVARATGIRGQPRPRAVGARRRHRPRERSRPPQPRRRAVSCRDAGGHHVHQPARVGVCAARHRRVLYAPFRATTRLKRCARSWPRGCSACFSERAAPTGRGSSRPSPTAMRGCHRRSSCPATGCVAATWLTPACARSIGWPRCSGRAMAISHPSAATDSFRRVVRAPPSISSRWRPARSCRPVSTPPA